MGTTVPMRIALLALLISILPAVVAHAGGNDEDDFDASQAIKAFFAEGPGCGGTDVDGSKLDPDIQDRRCAAMNAWSTMLEDHGYCFDEDKQEWKVCAATN
jgi:hypothetical protein